MHTVTVSRTLQVPAERAWQIIDDFGGVYRYHPNVTSSPIRNGIESGLGAERVCHFDDGNRITEAITAYEPGRSYTLEIVDFGKFPLLKAIGRIAVAAAGPERSVVTFEMRFQPKFGPLGWLMAKGMMRSQFAKILGRVVEGIEQHAKTGEVVGAKPQPAAA